MLKNKSKAFAPKFKAARRPGANNPSSAQSSARPSVEPQSQIPAPESAAKEPTPSIPEETPAPQQSKEFPPAVEPTPPTLSSRPAPQTEQSARAPETEANSSTPRPKRKTREQDAPGSEPAAKRVSFAAPEKVNPTVESNSPPSPTISTQKRKSREDDVAESASKRRATTPVTEDAETSRPSTTRTQPPLNTNANTNTLGALPSYILDLIGSKPTNPPSRETTQSEAPTQQPLAETNATSSNTIDLTEIADDQSSRAGSPESNHDSPRFRYPSPDNTQPNIPGYTTAGAAGGDLPGLGPAGNTNTISEGRTAQSSQAVPMAGLNPDGTAAPVVEEPASGTEKGKKKKKVIRRKKVQTAQEGDDGRATVDMQLNRPRRAASAKRSRKKKDGEKKKRTRAMTPEGAEDEIVDRSVMTVGELCKDIRIGKKFSKHEKVKANLAMAKEKAKLRQLGLLPETEEEEGRQANRNGERASTSQPNEDAEVAEGGGNSNNPQFKLVDGVIVIDETSLQVDRQERGRADIIEVEAVEEDDFTKPSTSGHHMKRERAQTWDYAGTELFYKGLRMFGTDFETIAKLFPRRTRRHIKLKFNKEERDWPQKIQKALSAEQRLDMDLVMFQQLSNLELVGTDVLQAEHAKIEQEHREEEERHLAEQAETIRKKREAIRVGQAAAKRMLASVDDDDTPTAGTESAKENAEPARGTMGEASAALKSKKKAAAKKKKKNMHSSNAGGEEVEILGFAD